VTDHRPLTWIFNVKDPSSRLLKWRLKLGEYEYEVLYKKDSNNTNADAHSRIHVAENSPDIQKIKPVPTKEERQGIFRDMHNGPVRDHLRMKRTYARIKPFTSWPGMKQQLEDFIRV
jgi:hypothetical protein